jgi:hypothetical protein
MGHKEPSIFRPDASQNVTFTGSSAQSSAFGSQIFAIRLCATAPCRVALGSNPSATNTDIYLPANQPEYFACRPGEKVAVMGDDETWEEQDVVWESYVEVWGSTSSNGLLNVVECTR